MACQFLAQANDRQFQQLSGFILRKRSAQGFRTLAKNLTRIGSRQSRINRLVGRTVQTLDHRIDNRQQTFCLLFRRQVAGRNKLLKRNEVRICHEPKMPHPAGERKLLDQLPLAQSGQVPAG